MKRPAILGSGGSWVRVSLIGLLGCAHPRSDEYQRMMEADFHAHNEQVLDFIRIIPACAEGQKALALEEALRQEFTPGECLVIEGRLVLDAGPVACRTNMQPSTVCPAQWMLLGKREAASRALLPGVRSYVEDAHTLFVRNEWLFDKPNRHCEDDDVGNARMPHGAWFRLPDAHRERVFPPAGAELASLRVAILGEVYDHCRDYPADIYGQENCAVIYASRVTLNQPWSWFDTAHTARVCSLEGTAARPAAASHP